MTNFENEVATLEAVLANDSECLDTIEQLLALNIKRFKEYALAHYEEGFDVFVEAFDDEELEAFFTSDDDDEDIMCHWDDMLKLAQSVVDVREERMNEYY